MKNTLKIIAAIACLYSSHLYAETIIEMHPTSNSGASLGKIVAHDTEHGLLLTPSLSGVPSGLHGFHLHTKTDCAEKGKAAGGHFDPQKTGKHLGPYNKGGHLGDLPALYSDSDGKVTLPVLAPRLHEADLKGHAIIIHAGGDNYSDSPKKLGGGGPRFACGIVKLQIVSQ